MKIRLAAIAALTALCTLSSCAIAPARLKRVMHAAMGKTRQAVQPSLHALLTEALRDPDSKAGKAALGDFVEEWKKERGTRGGLVEAPKPLLGDPLPSYRVSIPESGWGTYAFDYFDEISPADEFEVRKLEHFRREGVGTPLTALRENRNREPIEKYYPPEAITRPLTALATAGPVRNGVREVRIELLCPMATSTVVRNGRRQPLAADFSVPWAAALARAGKLNQSRVLDMLTPTPTRQPQLYLMEPYDPNKEPLIMIHGLLSSPLAWADLSNALWADEKIRQRYQIWHYLYNTSAPALYSARILRTQLKGLRAMLDPEGDDTASKRTTLLTHSMGGLVGKALAVGPGDAFWKAAFKVPHETLKLTPKERTELNDAFEWLPDPTVHRIIFIAVPHRGSSFADNFAGRIGRLITAPPRSFQTFYAAISKANPGVFTPEYQRLGTGRLNSVSSLSPSQPTLRIMAELPFRPGVQVHCIIGNRGREGPLEKSSDGIVPYKSSHLEGAASELIVPCGHRAFEHPLAVAEVKRVLSLK